MKFTDLLQYAITQNNSMLCVGLDPDPARFPEHWRNDRSKIFDFCAAIIDATADLVCAFKPQIAYFSAVGAEQELERVIAYIRKVAPQIPVILDAKRGDIGSTAALYAKEAFIRYQADAVTLSPYMGYDSITPYLKYSDKSIFLLCRTSNFGGNDLQNQRLADVTGEPRLFEHLAHLVNGDWGGNQQVGLVVGATYPHEIAAVRQIAPKVPLLIPGVGAQGGDAIATVKAGYNDPASVIINSSRAILYASNGKADFAAAARSEAMRTRDLLNSAI